MPAWIAVDLQEKKKNKKQINKNTLIMMGMVRGHVGDNFREDGI